MAKPIRPPAAKSPIEAASAPKSGRDCESSAGSFRIAQSSARRMGGIASPPPKRMSHVCSLWCSTEATGCAR